MEINVRRDERMGKTKHLRPSRLSASQLQNADPFSVWRLRGGGLQGNSGSSGPRGVTAGAGRARRWHSAPGNPPAKRGGRIRSRWRKAAVGRRLGGPPPSSLPPFSPAAVSGDPSAGGSAGRDETARRVGGWVGGSHRGFPSRFGPPHPGEQPVLGRNRANPGAVRCPAPAPRAEPRWPLLRHGAEPRAQSGGGGASSEPAPPGHGERRRRARGLGLRLGLGHGAAQPPPGDREAAGGHRGPGGPPGLQVLHGRLGRRGGAQRARARALLQVGVGRAPGSGPAVAVPAQPGQSLLHRHQHGGSRPGPPAGLPGARHLLLLLPRLAHQRGGPRLLHHVAEQRAAGGCGWSPAPGPHGPPAQHRLHRAGDHHHRALRLAQRSSFLEDVACKYLEEEEDSAPFGVFLLSALQQKLVTAEPIWRNVRGCSSAFWGQEGMGTQRGDEGQELDVSREEKGKSTTSFPSNRVGRPRWGMDRRMRREIPDRSLFEGKPKGGLRHFEESS